MILWLALQPRLKNVCHFLSEFKLYRNKSQNIASCTIDDLAKIFSYFQGHSSKVTLFELDER